MGVDIHAFVEVDYGTKAEPFNDADDIRAFNTGEFFILRNYDVFDALADGVSGKAPEEYRSKRKRALYPARGIPSKVSQPVADRYYLRVIEPGEDPLAELWVWDTPIVGVITRGRAEAHVAAGLSHFAPEPERYWQSGRGEVRRTRVSNGGWHHASWLTPGEVDAALGHFSLRIAELDSTFRMVLEIMARFEQSQGAGRTRLVVWFDN